MADRIRVGVVGATVTQGGSGWGANAHVPALRALPEFELKAVCTAHRETAEASREAFGAELAFHDINDMVAHPEIDLVAVCVRVPGHFALAKPALEAGKDTFCEWPLGANLAEAEELAAMARARGLRTLVGLQGRSDPVIAYARELVAEGYIGDVLAVHLTSIAPAIIERGPGRIWQAERAAGANTLTIQGGHAIDDLCYIAGEFATVSARLATKVPEWRLEGSGERVPVTSPDSIIVAGQLVNGAEAAVHIATVPRNASGTRLEIFGSEGALAVRPSGSLSIGPNALFGARGGARMEEMPVPERFTLIPEGAPAGSPRNVAQAYAALAEGARRGTGFAPSFDDAVVRHRLLDAIERSSAEGRAIALG